MLPLLTAVGAACASSPAPVVAKNPVTLQSDCTVPADQRVLRARLELERGEGALSVDGQTGGPCAVFALTPGEHQVAIHAAGEAAFGVAATVEAFSDGNRYGVFELRCGIPGSCDTETLRGWQHEVETDRSQMTDPCAALKVTNVHWESQKLDEFHPKSLDVSFVMHVYSKPSGKAPHDPSCPEK